jgi:hypothetical protein
MILSRLRYRPVTFPLPLQRYRDHRYIPLLTDTDRFQSLPSVTCVTQRYITLQTVT